MTSDYKFYQAFGDEGFEPPQFFPFETDFSGVSDPFLESSKILADAAPVADETPLSPLSLDGGVSDSFGLQQPQFTSFNIGSTPPLNSGNFGFAAFDLAPASPMDQYPDSPFNPFSVGIPSSSSVDQSDSESLAAVPDQSSEASQPVSADRSYFKVDPEFPWQVYIRDPERLERVTAWKKKKIRVLQEHEKKNTYQVRTDVANRRMRVKGRFVGKCIN